MVPFLSRFNREVRGLLAGCSYDYHGNVEPSSLAFELERLKWGPVRERLARRIILEHQSILAEERK